MIYSVTMAMIITEGLDVGSIQHAGCRFHRALRAAVTHAAAADGIQKGGI